MLKSKLVDYQIDIVSRVVNAPLINGMKNFLICAKPGTGKSLCAIAIAYKLIIDNEIDYVLWLTPANLKANLQGELDKHLDVSLHHHFKFVSHEALSLQKGLDGLTKRTYLIADECHRCKNIDTAKRSSYLLNNSIHAYGLLQMTGTPKGVHYNGDLYALLLLLGLDLDKPKFEYRFCLKSKMRYIGSKNTTQLMSIIDKNSIWVDKSPLNLPDKNHHIIDVPISSQLQKLSTDMAIHGEVVYNGTRVKKGIQTLLLLNSGYLSGMTDFDGNVTHYIGSEKPEALAKLITEIGQEQILIFCYFHNEIELISSHLTAIGASFRTRHGKNTKEANNQACVDFVANTTQIMLTTIPSSEMGLTFVNCNHTIYYNVSQSPTQLEQSQDRTHRFGQESDCHYYYLASGNLNHGLIEIQLDMIKEGDKMFKIGGDVQEFDLSKTMKKLAEKAILREEPITHKQNGVKLNMVEAYKHAFEDVVAFADSITVNGKSVTMVGDFIRSEVPGLEKEYQCKLLAHKDILSKSKFITQLMQKLILQPDLLPDVPDELKEYELSIYNFLADNSNLIPIMCNQLIGDESVMLADRIPLLFIESHTSKLIICDWTLIEPTELGIKAQKVRLNYRNTILKSRTKLTIKDNICVQFKEFGDYTMFKI